MTSQRTIRIVIADDHPVYRLGVKALLSTEPGFEVVGEAADGQQAVSLVSTLRPDILLLDFILPGLNGLDVLRRLQSAKTLTRTILVTATIQDAEIQTALLLGAWGVVLKETAMDILPTCIRRVLMGEHWVGVESVDAIVGGLRSRTMGGGVASLTPRELDVVRLVAKGGSNKDIASELGLTEQTVKNYLRSIFEKLNVTNRVELAVQIAKEGLGAEPPRGNNGQTGT
ncbi:MAG TPA: response regulator transcription factor [Vicinamibacterales bacterium]|nr:response regulator transcription factor [Vicinamibacterales bacterium]